MHDLPELSRDYFQLFGLARGFDLDAGGLAARYRELQKAVHPDRYASAPERERRLAVQHAARLNEAYRTLKDPLARARYLLELCGGAPDSEHDTTHDTAFLMEQMELREALAEVPEAADPDAALAALSRDIGVRYEAIVARLGELFADGSEDAHAAARDLVQKLQFLRRLQEEAAALEEDLADRL